MILRPNMPRAFDWPFFHCTCNQPHFNRFPDRNQTKNNIIVVSYVFPGEDFARCLPWALFALGSPAALFVEEHTIKHDFRLRLTVPVIVPLLSWRQMKMFAQTLREHDFETSSGIPCRMPCVGPHRMYQK